MDENKPDFTFGEDGNGDLRDLGLEVELEDVSDLAKEVKKGVKRFRKMQPATRPEHRPSRAGTPGNSGAGTVICIAVLFILYTIGSAVCGAIVFTLDPSTTYTYQIIAFIQSGFYIVTALYGLGAICKYKCKITAFFTTCLISALAGIGGFGYYCSVIRRFASAGVFENCQEGCLYIVVPVCVLAGISAMAFISGLIGSRYFWKKI